MIHVMGCLLNLCMLFETLWRTLGVYLIANEYGVYRIRRTNLLNCEMLKLNDILLHLFTTIFGAGNASSIEDPYKSALEVGERSNAQRLTFCSKLCGTFCFCLVREDCREDEEVVQQSSGEEEALFCTLCNAEVKNYSSREIACHFCMRGHAYSCLLSPLLCRTFLCMSVG